MKRLLLLALLLATTGGGFAQKTKSTRMPRVAALRSDEAAAEAHDGCGNHYLQFRGTSKALFVSDSEGNDAWMNLNGHTVRLELIEVHLWHMSLGYADALYRYRYKNVLVTVRLKRSSDYISEVPASLVVHSGRSTRLYRVRVAAQCD